MTTFRSNSSIIGVDFNTTTTGAQFALLSHAIGDNDSEWVYVYATAALVTGNCVVIQTAGTCILSNTANLVSTYGPIGFANGAFAAGDYGWVAVKGYGVMVAVSGSATLDTSVYNAVTSGRLTSISGGGSSTMAGICFLTTNSTVSHGAVRAVISWPRYRGTTAAGNHR